MACPTPRGKSTSDNVKRAGFFAANRTPGASRSTPAEISRPQPGRQATGCGYSIPKQYQQAQLGEVKNEKTVLPMRKQSRCYNSIARLGVGVESRRNGAEAVS